MNPKEHEELRRQVEDLLAKGQIRQSLSPCAIPTFLAPKKDESWRMCVDSQAINKTPCGTGSPYNAGWPLRPLEWCHRLQQARLEEQISSDLNPNRQRMKGYFKTREGLYEWLVMPFGLSNAPSTSCVWWTRPYDLTLLNVSSCTLMIFWFIVITLICTFSIFGKF